MSTCTCCGRRVPGSPVQQVHLDCWVEHHSDPTGPWPPDHECAFGEDDTTERVTSETDESEGE